MARPRKNETESRGDLIQVRVTTAEKAAFEQKAREAGLTPSDFLRALVQAKRIRQPKLSMFDREANVAMIRMGANLNQIARHLNNGGIVDPHTARMLEEIHAEMWKLSDRLMGRMDELGMFDGM